jgi:hypothetical protein
LESLCFGYITAFELNPETNNVNLVKLKNPRSQ